MIKHNFQIGDMVEIVTSSRGELNGKFCIIKDIEPDEDIDPILYIDVSMYVSNVISWSIKSHKVKLVKKSTGCDLTPLIDLSNL